MVLKAHGNLSSHTRQLDNEVIPNFLERRHKQF